MDLLIFVSIIAALFGVGTALLYFLTAFGVIKHPFSDTSEMEDEEGSTQKDTVKDGQSSGEPETKDPATDGSSVPPLVDLASVEDSLNDKFAYYIGSYKQLSVDAYLEETGNDEAWAQTIQFAWRHTYGDSTRYLVVYTDDAGLRFALCKKDGTQHRISRDTVEDPDVVKYNGEWTKPNDDRVTTIITFTYDS